MQLVGHVPYNLAPIISLFLKRELQINHTILLNNVPLFSSFFRLSHFLLCLLSLLLGLLNSDISRRFPGNCPLLCLLSFLLGLLNSVSLGDTPSVEMYNWGEPERGPHVAVYGDFVCLSCSLLVRTFTLRTYLCSNSTITHAQKLCQNFSHLFCVRVATCACQSLTSRGAWIAFENKNKPASVPIVVTMIETIFLTIICKNNRQVGQRPKKRN